MPSGLLLIPLLAGYVFLNICYVLRFRAQRQEGYRLLIESVLAGVPISLFAWRLAAMIHSRHWDFLRFEAMSAEAPIPYLGTATLAVAIAAATGGIANLFTMSMRSKWFVIRQTDNGFLYLAHQAIMQEKPVSLTLKNKKVYIGFVVRTPSLKPGAQYISVLPLASGYRDPQTVELVLTQDYTRVYDDHSETNLNPTDFIVTIPLSEIQSAGLFNPSAYPLFTDPGLDLSANREKSPPRARAAVARND